MRFPRHHSLVRLCACFTAVLAFVVFSDAQTQTRGSVDWILVLDTSASMHGAGGSANIFDRVKNSLSDFVRATREGDSVALYTFDRDTSLHANVRISGELDKAELLRTISSFSSDGDRTHTGKAIRDAMERATQLKSRTDAAQRTVSIVLFTDGLEDVRGLSNVITIPSNILLIPHDAPYLFFVSLGATEHERQLEEFVHAPAMQSRGEVVRDPGASRIAEVADAIRQKIESPDEPKKLNLVCEPSTLDFGDVEPGDTTRAQDLRLVADADVSVQLALNPGSDFSLQEPAGPVNLEAGKAESVSVRIRANANAVDGQRSIQLSVTTLSSHPTLVSHPVFLAVNTRVARIPLWRKLIKYAALLLVLLLIALVVISIQKGEPPWIWIPATIEGARLEGELQILHPRPAKPEDEFISLRQLNKKTVLLGSIISNGQPLDSDAELSVGKRQGEFITQLKRTLGTVKVNKVETSTTEIYNEDLIELSGFRIRFYWLNHDRPTDQVLEEDY